MNGPSNWNLYHSLTWISLIALMILVPVSAGDGPGAKDTESWQTKLSSDILQALDNSSCPVGITSDDIIMSMIKMGQARYEPDGDLALHVTIHMNNASSFDSVLVLISDPVQDASYRILNGWVTRENLSHIASHQVVKTIRPVFPPVGSGFQTSSGSNYPDTIVIPKQIHQDTLSDGSTWKRKLSTDLLQLLDDRYLSPGQTRNELLTMMKQTGEIREHKGEMEIRVFARATSDTTLSQYSSLFSDFFPDYSYNKFAGWISPTNLSLLAMQEGIVSLMVQIPPRTSGVFNQVQTEGDKLLGTDEFRERTGLSGEGIVIGVISDGVEGLDDLKKIGELPEVTVLSDTVGGDEGSAMLQIIYDIAPNSTLIFHDRGSSQIEYIRAFDALIRRGCKIICDDITFVEPFFEDGYLSQNILDRIVSYNILYITAAGNFAQEHYQAPFDGYEELGYNWHNFNNSEGTRDLKFSVEPGVAGHVILQWDDRFGDSANNYDLFLYEESGREIARSVNLQEGSDDPMEWVRFMNDGNSDRIYTVKVVQAAADDALLEIYVLPLTGSSIVLDPFTSEDSTFGQQAVKQGITVGSLGEDTENLTARDYSSRGPAYIRHPTPEFRKKPDVVAPDRISVLTGKMQNAIFSGTSASSPHIAGLAALIWSADPSMTYDTVRRYIVQSTGSNDLELDWKPDIGYGLPRAVNTIEYLSGNKVDNEHLSLPSLCTFEPRVDEQAGNITLYKGWNMVSIPYPLMEEDCTGEVFSAMNTGGHTIWRYNSKGLLWAPVRPGDMLSQMDVVWIFSPFTQYLNLRFDNTSTHQKSFYLQKGWNPIGVPGRESITAKNLFSPLGDAWSYILVFDPKTQEYRPSIINGGSGVYSENRLIYPAEGCWIYMNRPGLLFPV